MDNYKLNILPAAQRDLKEIVGYLNTLSPQEAVDYYDFIVSGIESLRQTPMRRPLAADAQLRLRGYRFLPIKNYLVFYVIVDDVVQIRRILYKRKQYTDLF